MRYYVWSVNTVALPSMVSNPSKRRFYGTRMCELAIGGLKTEYVVVRLFIYTWLLAKSNPI
jgi:hypothetical protein